MRAWVACIGLWVGAALADPVQELSQRLQSFQSLQADFVQLTRDAAGRDVQSIPGKLALARPNRLFWQTSDPIPQQIVSDGQSLWTYDIDLEQVTRDPVSLLDDSPAALLLNLNTQDLAERFEVTQTRTNNQQTVFQLRPLADSLYQLLVIEFVGDMPRVLGVVDSLDQQTRITLSGVRLNQAIDPERFQFVLPEGIDLLDNIGG